MSIKNDFENYLRLAKVFGFLCTTFHFQTSQLTVSKLDRIHEQIAVILVFIFSFSYMILFYNILLNGLFGHDVLGDRTIKIQIVFEFVLKILIVFWIFFTRKTNLKIVRQILGIINEAKDFPCRKFLGFKSSIAVMLIMTINIWTVTFCSYFQLNWLIIGVTLFVPQSYLYTFVSFEAFIVSSARSLLEIFNNEIEDSRTMNKIKLESILLKRYSLMKLCTKEFRWVHGVTMLIISAHMLLLFPSIPVLIAAAIEGYAVGKFVELFKILLSMFCGAVPPLVLYSIAMISSDLDIEANKTARILSRISKRGTGMEKMVDKFLIKNMQQKPILTAYGFFPLNKRTLFKIFAAIFTYMVILIQFKDMENTSKLLTSSGTITTTTEVS